MSPSNSPCLFVGFQRTQGSYQTGLSGAPVFNVTTSRLVGMVSRATMHSNLCRMRYIDIFDILQLLSAAHEGRAETAYTKTVLRSIDRR